MKANMLKRVVDILSACEIYTTPMRFVDGGISIKTMCPSHLRCVDVIMPKSCFDEYQLKECIALIDTQKMEKILKTSDEKEDVVVKFTGDPEYDTSHFKIGTGKNFSIRLDEYGEKAKKMPDFTPDVVAEMNADVLRDAINATSIFGGDVIAIVSNENGLLFSASDDNDNAEVMVSKDEMDSYECKSEVEVFFSFLYLKKITDKLSGDVILKLVKDTPITIVSKIGDAQATILIAPRHSR